jgi:hypothetical protein
VYRYVSNTFQHRSWLSNFVQTQSFGGEVLAATLYFKVTLDDRNELTGWFAKMNGMEHRVTLPVHKLNQRGAFGGTPVVNGASQTGHSITVSGASNTITNWIRTGDWFTIGSELKMCTESANSDGSGNVTIAFRPRIRTSPANGSSVETTAPTGRFVIVSPTLEWSLDPEGVSETSIEFVEDVT